MHNFENPRDNITGMDISFGLRREDLSKFVPSYKDIPKEFKDHTNHWYDRLSSDWFYSGLKSTEGLITKNGINKKDALAHIKSILTTWEIPHEHKMAAVAYLLNLWFDEKSTWQSN